MSAILLSLVLLGAAAEVPTRETPTERLFVLTIAPGVAFQLDGKSAAQVVDVPSDATKMIVEVELDGHASQRREVAVVAAGRVPQIKFEFGRANARTRVEEFLAAALAGKVDEAAALADDQFPARQIRELRDRIKARTVSVVTVLASDTGPRKKALAITQRVQVTKADPDGRDTGKLVITLANRGDRGWLVEDIDLESDESIEVEVHRFLKDFPEARPVPPLPSHEEAFPGDSKIRRRDAAPSAAPADTVIVPILPSHGSIVHTEQEAELRRVGAKMIAKGARGSWSPDGKRIAVGKMPFGSGIAVVEVTGRASLSQSRLPREFVLDSEVGSVEDLIPDGKDPAWSPDGKWIAFTREVGSGAGTTEEIWLTAADPVVPGKPAAGSRRLLGTGVMATWSADAKTVFFSNPQTHAIFSVPVAKPDTVSVWNAIGDRFPDLWYPIVHPDGRYVAYHADGQLKIADMAVGKIVADWPLDGWRGWLGGWSCDGTRLGYGASGGEDKGLWELPFIFLGNLKLSPPRRILSGSCTLPSWLPDGSKLAFDFRSPQRGYEVWIVDAKQRDAASTSSEGKSPSTAWPVAAFDGFDGRLCLPWKAACAFPSWSCGTLRAGPSSAGAWFPQVNT